MCVCVGMGSAWCVIDIPSDIPFEGTGFVPQQAPIMNIFLVGVGRTLCLLSRLSAVTSGLNLRRPSVCCHWLSELLHASALLCLPLALTLSASSVAEGSRGKGSQ